MKREHFSGNENSWKSCLYILFSLCILFVAGGCGKENNELGENLIMVQSMCMNYQTAEQERQRRLFLPEMPRFFMRKMMAVLPIFFVFTMPLWWKRLRLRKEIPHYMRWMISGEEERSR